MQVEQSEVILFQRGGRIESKPIGLYVNKAPEAQVPIPTIQARLHNNEGRIIAEGFLAFKGDTLLPATGSLVFATIEEKGMACFHAIYLQRSDRTYIGANEKPI